MKKTLRLFMQDLICWLLLGVMSVATIASLCLIILSII